MEIAIIIAIAIFLITFFIANSIYFGRQYFVASNDKILNGSFIVALMSFAAIGAFTVIYNIMFI